MKYKALSVVAPAGQLIAQGRKTIEVRSWIAEDLRADEDLLIVENTRLLLQDGDSDPDGRAVAIVRVREFTEADVTSACASRYEAGWWSWVLEDVRPIHVDRPVLAARKIYEVELSRI